MVQNTCDTWVPKLASISVASIPPCSWPGGSFDIESQCGTDTASSAVSPSVIQCSLSLSAFLPHQIHTGTP